MELCPVALLHLRYENETHTEGLSFVNPYYHADSRR